MGHYNSRYLRNWFLYLNFSGAHLLFDASFTPSLIDAWILVSEIR